MSLFGDTIRINWYGRDFGGWRGWLFGFGEGAVIPWCWLHCGPFTVAWRCRP